MKNDFFISGKKAAGWAASMIVIFSAQTSEVQAS